jgi:hypothetical protein
MSIGVKKDELESLYYAGKTYKEIADALKVTVDTVKYYAKKYGIKARSSGRRRLPVLGERFGRLKVLRVSEQAYKTPRYICLCDCGCEVVTTASNLKKGQERCWDCRNKLIADIKWKGHGEISGELWDKIQRSAKKRGYKVEITIEQAWDLFLEQDRTCKLSGVEISFARNRKSPLGTASLDRKDSKGDYTIGNVQWLHKSINKMKWCLNDRKFVEWCQIVADNNRLLAR